MRRAARGKYYHRPNVGNFIWTRISPADVADFMLKQLTDDKTSDRRRACIGDCRFYWPLGD